MATNDIPEERIYTRQREQEYPELADLNLVHTTVLLPLPKIQDKYVLQKIKDKAKLGFGGVHAELKKMIKRKQRDVSRTHSLDIADNPEKTKKKEKLKPSTSVDESKSAIQREPSFPIHKRKNVPLPPLPRETATSVYVIEDNPKSEYDYVAIEHLTESKPRKVTARVPPISASKRNPTETKGPAKVLVPNLKTRRPDVHGIPTKSSPRGSPTPEYEDSVTDYGPLEDQYDDTKYPTSEKDGSTDTHQPPSGLSFFLYSVDEVVQCLEYCGLRKLAAVCKEQNLDGNFFQSTEGDKIKSLFNLSGLEFLKLEKIFDGWRPKLG